MNTVRAAEKEKEQMMRSGRKKKRNAFKEEKKEQQKFNFEDAQSMIRYEMTRIPFDY